MIVATYGGSAVFGSAVRIRHLPNPAAVQVDGFFGLPGRVSLFGGSRGRVFEVRGLLVGGDTEVVMAAEYVLLSYADGIARVLVDTQGRAWPNVVFLGEYEPDAEGPKPTDWGWCLPYRCTFEGLT